MQMIPDFLNFFRLNFTEPSFQHFKRLIYGFLQNPGCKALTELNQSQDWNRHFSSIYDFLKRSKWSHLDVSQTLWLWLQRQFKMNRPILCIDDTKAIKNHANKIPDVCWHADHHHRVKAKVKTEAGEELTATGVVGHKGHCWVVLAAMQRLSQSQWCCFPLRASIFVREKYAAEDFKSKHQLGLELFESLRFEEKPLLVGDNFYGSASFVNEVDADVLSLLKSNAVAFEPLLEPTQRERGRPRKYGRKVKLIEELNLPEKLKPFKVHAYGKQESVEIASFQGLLRGHKRTVRIILVKGLRKKNFLLFTNDLNLSEVDMVEHYSGRFQIEIAFRELKQDLGAFNYRLRNKTGILRYVHLAFVAYALIKQLAIQGQIRAQETPWYKPKCMASPRRVQQVLRQKIQGFRIFQGVEAKAYPHKNTGEEALTGLRVA